MKNDTYTLGYVAGLETMLRKLKKVRLGPGAASSSRSEFKRGFDGAVYLIVRDLEDGIEDIKLRVRQN